MKEGPAEIDILRNSIKESVKGSVSIAFSGGLDSSLIALLAIEAGVDAEARVVGTETSHDLEWASYAADMLGLRINKTIVSEDEILEAASDVANILDTRNPVTISFELPLYFVARDCRNGSILTGQGADEIFGGYKRYESMKIEELCSEMENDLENLLESGIERDMKIASHFGKELITPYLNPEFLNAIRKYPPEIRKGAGRKDMLRNMALSAGLPPELALKEKKAAQYGSGVMKVLKKNMDILNNPDKKRKE